VTPSERVAGEIRERIARGELGPGDRVPSARQITREWGVAIATATRVLALLRDEGLVRAVPGVGTVVATGPPPTTSPPSATAPTTPAVRALARATVPSGLTRDRIARAAVRIADVEGIAALSMRRVAADLGLATMSLYRYVQSKDELVVLMIDAVFGEYPPQEPPPPGWRAQLGQLSRLQWRICQEHPWLARATSFTRPQMAPGGMAHTEWAMRAVAGLGIDPATSLYVVLTLVAFTLGTAANLESEAEAEQATGQTSAEWMEQQEESFEGITGSGRYPHLRSLAEVPGFDLELDTLFDFGLERVLDGLAVFLDPPSAARYRPRSDP
jgi:DNA-binding transcriptional regulator YhcF (GntR family)